MITPAMDSHLSPGRRPGIAVSRSRDQSSLTKEIAGGNVLDLCWMRTEDDTHWDREHGVALYGQCEKERRLDGRLTSALSLIASSIAS